MVLTENFVGTPTEFTRFISRIAGVSLITLLYALNQMDIATALPIALAYSCVTAVIGPLYAEMNFECKPAHKAAFLMAPLLVAGFLAL